jgi:hypothetical protein
MSGILEVCTTLVCISFTAVVVVGSILLVFGMIMVMLGRDHD